MEPPELAMLVLMDLEERAWKDMMDAVVLLRLKGQTGE